MKINVWGIIIPLSFATTICLLALGVSALF